MRSLQSILLGILATTTLSTAQTIDLNTLPECAKTCLANMQAKFGDFACSTAEDFDCLCRAPDWRNGISECSKANCEGGEASTGFQQVTAYANEMCAIVTGAPAEEAPSSTAVPETSISSSRPAEPTTQALSTSTETATTEAPTTLITRTISKEGATASSDEPSAASATGGSSDENDNQDSNDDTNDGSEEGTTADGEEGAVDENEEAMSTGTKIGIGIGAGAVVAIMLAALIALVRSRKAKKKQNAATEKDMMISSPMPGSGRSYASNNSPPRPKAPKTTLEFGSTRYENMVPRTQPRLTENGP